MNPIIILIIGVAIVLSMILILRINAFIALICAAFSVSLLSEGEMATKISRVGDAFGKTAGDVGILIALAAVIGRALMDSGAASRIVLGLMKLLGEKRAKFALMGSGFILSVPVFFDTVFYLLVPLARSLFRKTKKNYLLYITAIVAGGAVTHTMVPPTPGPIIMTNNLGINLGMMILVGTMVAIPMSLSGIWICEILNRRLKIPMRPVAGTPEPQELDSASLPPIWLSLLPVCLPVFLISMKTTIEAIVKTFEKANSSDASDASNSFHEIIHSLDSIFSIVGNPNFALLISAIIAIFMVAKWRNRSLKQLSFDIEQSLMSGGLVILITAAGGAFGKTLEASGIDGQIKGWVGEEGMGGLLVIIVAAMVSSFMKFAQGSSTVAMITASSIFAGIGLTTETLGFHVVYLACAIGSGSLIGDWMNDSGFWVFAKMSGLTEQETLKSWTILTAAMGFVGLFVTLIFAIIFPMKG